MITHSKPLIEEDDLEAVEAVLRSGMIAGGQRVSEFESQLCRYVGAHAARATPSGRLALLLALLLANVGPGDDVIVPTYVCRSVMDAVTFVGARPVVADIDESYCLSPGELGRLCSVRTKCIIVAHIFGIGAKIREILEFAGGHGIYVIEDCAQAIGGEIDGQKLGTFGDMSFFSFQATKVMTTGEGGMLLVNTKEFLPLIEERIHAGGVSFAMTDIQGALGLSQLGKLPAFLEKRRLLARRYMEALDGSSVVDIPVGDMSKSIFFRFPVRIKKSFDFERLRIEMEDKGICLRKGVDLMLHQIRKGPRCPNADLLFRETVSLPIYPAMQLSAVDQVAATFQGVLEARL